MKSQMRRTFFALIVGVITALISPAAHAISAPHNQVTCTYCHVAQRNLGPLQPSNVCLSCHGSGLSAGTSPFVVQDMANPFRTFTSAVSGTKKFTQSSHNWSSVDNFPPAGAQPPLTYNMNSVTSLNGRVSCARCHEIHASPTDTSRGYPLLRMGNTNDAMCMDCHRSRNTADQTRGTHPVNFTYTSSRKLRANPANFFNPPLNSNPSNQTSALKLPNGMLICSTCHGVHFADSNNSTFHNSTSAVLGRLSTSRGFLLRTNARGATATSINICTNCHANKTNHNGSSKQQNVQCVDCHGGHVDYDPLGDPNGLKNVFLINRYMNISTVYGVVRKQRVFFQYTGVTSRNYKDANGNGVCQACHQVPTGGSYPPEHSLTTASAANCNTCHNHTSTSGSFSGSCTTCHGYPPTANISGGPNGYANDGTHNYATSGVFKDESVTPHAAHAGSAPYQFSCYECHSGNTHASGTFQDVFISTTNSIAASNGAAPVYNKNLGNGNETCTTTYCHSNGAPRGQATVYTSPRWAGGKNTIVGTAGECTSCHGNSTSLATNAHQKHVNTTGSGKGYSCDTCHAATVSGSTTINDQTKHVNGNKDILFSGTAVGSSWDSTGAGCTTYCHSNGATNIAQRVYASPIWTSTATGACGTCHATSNIASNDHTVHLSGVYGPQLGGQGVPNACQNCHTYTSELAATHINGSVEAPSSNCTASCHSQGTGTASWTNSQQVSCESCHTTTSGTLSAIYGITAPDKTSSTTTGHGNPSGANKACLDCHDRNQQHISSNPTVHYKRLSAALTGSGNTECMYCHNNLSSVNNNPAFVNMTTHVTVKGGGQSMTCATCHELHGTSNLSMIRTKIAYLNSTSWTINFTDHSTGWVNTVTNRGLCQVCHTQTNHYRAGVAESNHATTDCFNCHKHNATGGAFKPNGGCNACHGYPPAPKNVAVTFGRFNNWSGARFEDYSGGGGAHLVAAHIKKDARPSEGWANCAICHNGGNTSSAPNHQMITPVSTHISNVTISVDPRYRYVPSQFVIYSGAKLVNPPSVNKTGSCYNASCHLKPSPRWGTER